MIRKWLLLSFGFLCAASAANAGTCRGAACRDAYFSKDKDGCLEVRNMGREDIDLTVYTTMSIPITVHLMSGATEKIYKNGRICLPAADYVRSDAEFSGGTFTPSR